MLLINAMQGFSPIAVILNDQIIVLQVQCCIAYCSKYNMNLGLIEEILEVLKSLTLLTSVNSQTTGQRFIKCLHVMLHLALRHFCRIFRENIPKK